MHIIFLLAALACASTQVAGQKSRLVSLVSIAEYFGEVYTALPRDRAQYVLFVGEPLKLRVSVLNGGPDDEELRLKSPELVEENVIVEASRDGKPFLLRIAVTGAVWHQPDGYDYPLEVSKRMQLRAKETLRWGVAVLDRLPAGEYRIRITLDAMDGQDRPILPRASFIIVEVRAQSDDTHIEMARREASRLFADGDYQGAEAAVTRLERLYPTSVSAALLRGWIAQARGDTNILRVQFSRALELLRNGEDKLLLRYKTQAMVDEMIQNIKALGRLP